MKIYKIASMVPDGKVHVKISFKPDGTYDAKIVGRGSDTSCNTENDAALIAKVLSGLAKTMKISNSPEALERGHTAPSHTQNPFDQAGPFAKQVEDTDSNKMGFPDAEMA